MLRAESSLYAYGDYLADGSYALCMAAMTLPE